MRHIVTIGGGSGQCRLLTGLRTLPDVRLTAVVSTVDSGGSSGRLRSEREVPAPGDILKCLVALADDPQGAALLLQRFRRHPRLQGHNAGNLLLTMLADYTGRFADGIEALAEILKVRGTVLPVTTDRATLVAELVDGSRVFGETRIDRPGRDPRAAIENIFLVPHHGGTVGVFAPAVDALHRADAVVLGPGDLFTSLIPNLMVDGIGEALRGCGATLVFPVNLMTKHGETDGFRARDFVHQLERRMGRQVDVVLINTRRPDRQFQSESRRHGVDMVGIDRHAAFWQGRRVIETDLLDTTAAAMRHDPVKLAGAVDAAIGPAAAVQD